MKLKLLFSGASAASLTLAPRVNAANAGSATTATNAGSADTMTALFGDPVIAKGKGVEIKQSELDQVVTGMKATFAARGQTIPPAQLNLISGQMLNRLIQIQLLMQHATAADKAQGQKKADDQMAALLKRAGSQETLDQQLLAVGMTASQLKAKVLQEATAMAVLQRELGVTVTDAEMKKYYDDHPAEFEQPEMIRAQHILLGTRDPMTGADLPADQKAAKKKQLEDILKRARAGEDFGKLAEAYSDDPGAKDDGGVLEFPRGSSSIPIELETAAFALNTNQISDVITLPFGYDIIKMLGKVPAKKLDYDSVLPNQTPPNALKVSDYIKNKLTSQKVEQLAPPFLKKLMQDADVQILDKNLKAAIDSLSDTNAPADALEK